MSDHDYLMDSLEENERLQGELLERNAQLLRANDEIERLRKLAGDLSRYRAQWEKDARDTTEKYSEALRTIERLRKVERNFSDRLGFTDFAEGVGPVYATADQMIEQIRREREQSEEYWAEIERLREKIKQLNLLVDEREEQEAEIAGWKR